MPRRRWFVEKTFPALRFVGMAVFAIVVVAGILYIAFAYFEGWVIALVLALELLVGAVLFHAIRWARYPGLFQSKTVAEWILKVLLTWVFFLCIPVVAVLAVIPVIGHAGLAMLGKSGLAGRCELEFPFKRGDRVKFFLQGRDNVSTVEGRVQSIRVITSNEITFDNTNLPGTVVYKLRADNGEEFEVPEQFLQKA